MKGLPVNLLKTACISVFISVVINILYYILLKKNNGYDNKQVIPLIMLGSLYINIILVVMAAPSLFLSYKVYWENRISRVLLYFSGPVLFIVSILFKNSKPADTLIYLLTAMAFLLVYAYFYNRLTKRNAA